MKASPYDDHLKLTAIHELITSFSLENAKAIFKEFIELDLSLNLLFRVTSIVPENVPKIASSILSESILEHSEIPKIIDYQ